MNSTSYRDYLLKGWLQDQPPPIGNIQQVIYPFAHNAYLTSYEEREHLYKALKKRIYKYLGPQASDTLVYLSDAYYGEDNYKKAEGHWALPSIYEFVEDYLPKSRIFFRSKLVENHNSGNDIRYWILK